MLSIVKHVARRCNWQVVRRSDGQEVRCIPQTLRCTTWEGRKEREGGKEGRMIGRKEGRKEGRLDGSKAGRQ
jgi:hypothetical protein